jgi:hypothetical protein
MPPHSFGIQATLWTVRHSGSPAVERIPPAQSRRPTLAAVLTTSDTMCQVGARLKLGLLVERVSYTPDFVNYALGPSRCLSVQSQVLEPRPDKSRCQCRSRIALAVCSDLQNNHPYQDAPQLLPQRIAIPFLCRFGIARSDMCSAWAYGRNGRFCNPVTKRSMPEGATTTHRLHICWVSPDQRSERSLYLNPSTEG